MCSVGAITLLPEIGLCALGYLGGAIAAHLAPEHVRLVQGLTFSANAAFFGWGLWNHARRSRAAAMAPDRRAR